MPQFAFSSDSENERVTWCMPRVLLAVPDVHFIMLSIDWALPGARYWDGKMSQIFFLCSRSPCLLCGYMQSQSVL